MKALIFDVETIDLKDKSIFDFSYMVVDKKTLEIEETGAYVIEEGWAKIDRAYFSGNKQRYLEGLKAGTYKMINSLELRTLFNRLVAREEIEYLMAFNIKFDVAAIAYTFNKYAGSKKPVNYERLSKYGTIFDIGTLASSVASLDDDYVNFCKENNLVTPKGNVKTSAEAFYSYIIQDSMHVETHMGMQDVIEEFEIYRHFYNILEKMKNKEDKDKFMTNIINLSYKKTPFWKIVNK
ncbi:hypothetical protein KAU11_10665 [Candidatus Babeliales bacterium]|nr:hypothetical protein [Candidatus Babeliales bacterium]